MCVAMEQTSDRNVLTMERASTVFEVRVPGVLAGEEVRVSGSVETLGKWSLQHSAALKRNASDEDLWSVCVDLPISLTVEYRYLVVHKISSRGQDLLQVVRWETTMHRRQICLRTPSPRDKSEDVDLAVPTPVVKQDGEFGRNDVGECAEDKGWLVGTSELQLQLHASLGSPISIDFHPINQCYSVRVQPMNYCAKTEDVCEVHQSSPIRAKVMDRETGDCDVVEPGPFGVPYQDDKVVVYCTEAPTFAYSAFIVDIFSVPVAGAEPEHFGRASILPKHLVNAGTLVLTVMSSQLTPIGTITFTYLLIHPVKDCSLVQHCKYSYANYWKKHHRPLDIGHRGLGDSFKPIREELKPSATENTITSLKRAGAHGADYVEFDVQLTRDLVPVVYHDFAVCTTLAKQEFQCGELYEVFVKDLTLRQLHNLKLEHTSVLSAVTSPTPSRSPSPFHRNSDVDLEETVVETLWGVRSRFSMEEGPESKTFPTFEQLFKSLPSHIGFNVEVKYPVPIKENPKSSFRYFDRNLMADIILRVVYQHARKRKIIFSCFDPDMCTILRRKQPKYPVIFLSGTSSSELSVDIRARSIKDATMFALSERLLGVDLYSAPLLHKPELVPWIKSKGLVVFAWGDDSKDSANIRRLKEVGVAAVIYDRITHLLAPQKNVFEEEEEEEQLELVGIRLSPHDGN